MPRPLGAEGRRPARPDARARAGARTRRRRAGPQRTGPAQCFARTGSPGGTRPGARPRLPARGRPRDPGRRLPASIATTVTAADPGATIALSPRRPPMPRDHALDYLVPTIRTLRADLALALRAAAHHGLGEGVCNHFSVELPDGRTASCSTRAGCTGARSAPTTSCWSTAHGARLAGRHRGRADRDVHPRRRAPHRAQGLRAAHPHAVRDRAHAHRRTARSTPRCRRTRCAFTAASRSTRSTTAWRSTLRRRAHRASDAGRRRRLPRQPRRGRLRRAHRPRLRRPLLPRARLHGAGAGAVDRPAAGAGGCRRWRARGRAQTLGERLQSELFFEALRRTVGGRR